jgi:hypothetical protein
VVVLDVLSKEISVEKEPLMKKVKFVSEGEGVAPFPRRL